MQPCGSSDHLVSGVALSAVFDSDENAQLFSEGLGKDPGLVHKSEVAQAFIGALRGSRTREERLQSIGQKRIRFGNELPNAVREELTSAFLFFIEYFLLDHRLTPSEESAIIEARELLMIEEESLRTSSANEKLRSLVEMQIDHIQADYQIDSKEEVFLVSFQRVFDLGYDYMRESWTPHVTELLNQLHLQLLVADREDIRDQIDQLKRTFCMLSYRAPAVGSQNVDEVAARTISQSVKDLVWRRDLGKCAKCGSNQLLEFDHIIPFSRGGSGTYRNIQLLCRPCNRSKSASLH